ncbi:MAG: penicillin acylase family protein [Saprospirales bacterium]|nr:penicillin acylase family protein [Saprospirales bacterium]
MRYFQLLFTLLLTLGLVWFLNTSNPLGIEPLPPLGKLLNPYGGFWQNAEAFGEYDSKGLSLPGLSGPVNIIYDSRMVPHIFAENLKDALMAQGYVVAKHRLWQMDLAARSGAGRLSEVMGERTAEYDRFQRRRGLYRGAEASLKAWARAPDTMALLQAYTDGVNAYISTLKPKDYPVEFKILDYAPEPWSPIKTGLVQKLNTALLCFRETDVEATNTLAWLGEDVFRSLFPERPQFESSIVPDSCQWVDSLQAPSLSAVPPGPMGFWDVDLMPKPDRDLGSNNWAVSGKKTSSGSPILCNDPHLPLSLPSLWMEMQIHTPDMNVYGVTLPGLPGIVLGFNEYVAWGWTNAGHDVLDWYEVDWTDPAKTHYLFDGQQKAATVVVDTIKIRGSKPVLDTLVFTHWGPIVYQDAKHPKRNLAMRWAAVEEPGASELGFLLGINAARNYDEFQKASSGFHFPGQNMAFAARDGDIALTVTGRFPIKGREQGRFIQKGDNSASFWSEFIPFTDLPRMKNPKRGFVSSANQLSAGPNYPYYYNGDFNVYRGRYADRRLAERNNFTIYAMMDLQTSNFSILAEEALPEMLRLLDTSRLTAIEQGLVQLLGTWDYQFHSFKIPPVIFDEWWHALDTTLWDEFHTIRDTLAVMQPERWRTVQLLKEDPMNGFWDILATPERETPQQTVTEAFRRAIRLLRPRLDEADYNWGKHHAVQINHLARLEAFSAPPLYPGGYAEALNATRPNNGPSWRMVVEMGPEIKAYGVYPGGQSGNPGSPYYDNFLEPWAKGLYFPLFFMSSEKDRKQDILYEEVLSPL